LHGAATKEKEGLVPLSAVSYIEPPGEAGNRDPEKVSGRKKNPACVLFIHIARAVFE
jgi:hypothetical protein